jgi:hypothetical protein
MIPPATSQPASDRIGLDMADRRFFVPRAPSIQSDRKLDSSLRSADPLYRLPTQRMSFPAPSRSKSFGIGDLASAARIDLKPLSFVVFILVVAQLSHPFAPDMC